jgi:uncharacterized protein (DUF2267 family)
MATNNDPFETTLHKTNAWLADIQRRLAWNDRHRAWSALRAVLHVLRDRLPLEEAVALGAQLPLLVRGAYYEGWKPNGKPERIRRKEEFIERVRSELRGYDEEDFEEIVNVVFDVLAEHISPGEAEHLARLLPKHLAELWPA